MARLVLWTPRQGWLAMCANLWIGIILWGFQSTTHAHESALNLSFSEQSEGDFHSPFSPLRLKPSSGTQILQAFKSDPVVGKFLSSSSHQLVPLSNVLNSNIQTFKFQHLYNGIAVIGSLASYHDGTRTHSTNSLKTFDLNTEPTVLESDLPAILGVSIEEIEKAVLKIIPDMEQNSAQLVYIVQTPKIEAIVDAHDGRIVSESSHYMEIQPKHTFDKLVDVYDGSEIDPKLIDSNSCSPTSNAWQKVSPLITDGQWVSQKKSRRRSHAAREAYENAIAVLSYYSDQHERDSYDDRGAELVNVVHLGDKCANAFWSRRFKFVGYGDGDGETFYRMTSALDVAGHEITHAVMSEAVRSGGYHGFLTYGEFGSVSEALADFFGEMIEGKDNWVMGQDLFLDESDAENGIRNIKDPNSKKTYYQDAQKIWRRVPFPKHTSQQLKAKEKCSPANQNCYKHLNSTILSHALMRLSQEIGRAESEALIYQTSIHYLTPTTTFSSFKSSTLEACKTLFDDQICRVTEAVFEEVGI